LFYKTLTTFFFLFGFFLAIHRRDLKNKLLKEKCPKFSESQQNMEIPFMPPSIHARAINFSAFVLENVSLGFASEGFRV